jgi:DNA-binding SARP family transcriptional activator
MTELEAAIAEENAAAKRCSETSELCKRLDEQQRSWLLRRETAFQAHAKACFALVKAKEQRERLENLCMIGS